MAKKNEVRANYTHEFATDSTRQFMECGVSIPSDFAVSGKALGLVNIMKNFPIGYKVSYSDLLNRKWAKWIAGNPSFKASDQLSAQDVKKAIRGFYAMVSRGDIVWKDGKKHMLEYICTEIGKNEVEYTLCVSEYRDGLFTLSEPKEESEESKSESKVLKSLEKLLKTDGISEIEKHAIEIAIAEIKTPKAVKVEKAA